MYSVNRVLTVSTTPITPCLWFTVIPQPDIAVPMNSLGIPCGDPDIVVNDAADLASCDGNNELWRAPAKALQVGLSVQLNATSVGFTVSALPPGVGLFVEF